MTRLALHLNNCLFADDDLRRIIATGIREFVDLSDYRARWPFLPGAVHARVNVRGALGDPEKEAAEFVAITQAWPAKAATWRYRNEPNIESPGVTLNQWYDWLVRFGERVKRLQADGSIFALAVSPGTADWLDWLDATAEAAQDADFDGLDAHAYGTPDEVCAVLAATRARWPRPKRLIVTEHNFGAGREYNLTRYAADIPAVMQVCAEYDVEVLGLFLWYWWHPDSKLITPVDIKGSVVEVALQNIPREVGMANYSFTLGFAAYAAAHPEVGLPISELQYDANGNGYQYCENGMLIWAKQANCVQFYACAPKNL